MLAIVAAIILLERHGRRRQRYASTQRARAVQPKKLQGSSAAFAFALGWLPIIIGFIAPAISLQNGSASRRERVCRHVLISVEAVSLKTKVHTVQNNCVS